MNRSPRQARGFTLIEILVVVMIVGIVMSVAVMSLGILGDDREVRNEARRVASLIEVALDESMLQGREYGLEFMVSGYRFVEFDPLTNQWAEVFGDELLRPRQLPEGVEFDLFLEERRVDLDLDASKLETEEDDGPADSIDNYTPHLLIFSSGDVTPFELHLYREYDDQRVVIAGDFVGNIEFIVDEEWQ